MFQSCSKLNGPSNIGSWDVSKARNMTSMFTGCASFNQNIGNWNTANVVSMHNMFTTCYAFNQNLGSWTIKGNVTLAPGMDCSNYSATLIGWSQNTNNNNSLSINASGLNHGNQASAAKTTLTKATGSGGKGWTITDGGVGGVCADFVTKWNLATNGSGATQLSFKLTNSNTVNYSWTEVGGTKTGSGTFTTGTNTTRTITGLPTGATIRLRIKSTNLQAFSTLQIADNVRLVDVEQWGTTKWSTMAAAIWGCSNLTNITATDIPDLSTTDIKMENMFQSCSKLNGPSNIGSWDVSKARNMTSMFTGCGSFNQNIGNWNTANVVSMHNMFGSCNAFNQNLGSWTIKGNVTLAPGMDCSNYSATLIGWSQNSNNSNTITITATGLKYGAYASSARTTLTGTKSWTINDGGQGTCSAPSVPGLEDQTAMNEVIGKASIWPNPVADMLNIEINEIYQDEKLYLTVTDMKGSVLMSQTVTHGNSAISTAGWPNALYVVTLRSEHDIIMISKISKQ
jgi:surface protein